MNTKYSSRQRALLFLFFGLFLIHRTLSSADLSAGFNLGPSAIAQAFVIGVLSDVWIAGLMSLLFAILVKSRRAFGVVGIVFAFLLAGHQTYVSFFKAPIYPFQFQYLVDISFLKSNWTSNLEWKPVATFVLSLLVVFVVTTWKRFQTLPNFTYRLGLIPGLILIHAFQIKYKVQWFVPEPMQLNVIENITHQWSKSNSFVPVTDGEVSWARSQMKKPNAPMEWASVGANGAVANEVLKPLTPALTSLGTKLKIVIVLAESLRPSDMGFERGDGDPASLTPFLDHWKSKSIYFKKAYSVGTVTRAGQEAVWCGVPSGTTTSLMRSFRKAPVVCLPKIAGSKGIKSAWIHGGDHRFDSQAAFWDQQGVKTLVTSDSFDYGTPKTSWGISDLAVFDRTASEVTKSDLRLTMVLSVTNHIPWDLPSDAPDDSRKWDVTHPSQKTTAYFDYALGQFVARLEKNTDYQNTLVILVSDHGTQEPYRNSSYKNGRKHLFEDLQSHIVMMVGGGAIEKAGFSGVVVNDVVSQAGIADFVARVLGEQATYAGFGIDQLNPNLTTFVDLNQYVYLPEKETLISKEDVSRGTYADKSATSMDPAERLSLIRYRLYLSHLLNQAK
jgi:phosphoglycerol transferase MdoB-like AlkP superfamily enzyme